MGIINIVLQGDLSSQTVKLDDSMKLHSLKLLHLYHNINSESFDKTTARGEIGSADANIQNHQRILFARISFINNENSATYFIDPDSDAGVANSLSDNLICLGTSKHNTDKNYQFKDLYKVLVSDIPKVIDQAFKVDLYTISSTGTLIHLIPSDFIAKGAGEHSHLVMTFEYSTY